MTQRSILTASTFALLLALPGAALADAPNEPCEGQEIGAACVTLDGEDGTCQETQNGFVDCVEGGTTATTTAGATASASSTTTAGTTTSASTASGAGGSGGGGDTGAGGTTGGATEEDGCAVRAPSSKTTGRVGASIVFLAAALATARRWSRRRAGAGASRTDA